MKKILIPVLAAFLALTLLLSCFSAGIMTGRSIQKVADEGGSSGGSSSLEKIEEVMDIVRDTYVEKISTEKLITGAVEGMIKVLDDPYSKYLNKKHFKMVEEEAEGNYEGVGIMLGMEDSKLTVISPIKNTPAEKAGIKTNDVIVEIDDQTTKDMTINQAVKLIRGKVGTTVVLTIEREGEAKPLEFKLERAKINIPNVTSEIVDGDIGYIRLHYFSRGAGEDIKKAVKDLKDQGAKGIIFDLRNNPGGLLDESIDVASAFVESGVIVKIKERKGNEKAHYAKGGADANIPLVVLVNKGSASASEIVAGAIQDTGRGVIVGETTFGKGSVQEVRRLSDGSGLLVTVAKYFTPKGRSIHKKGVKPDEVIEVDPDVPLKDKDLQLDKAKEIIKDRISSSGRKNAA